MQYWKQIVGNKKTLFRALRIALVVGTVLMLINHGESIFAGTMDTQHWLKVMLTYLVPFLVSVYSSCVAQQGSTALVREQASTSD